MYFRVHSLEVKNLLHPHVTFWIDTYPTRTWPFPGNGTQTQNQTWAESGFDREELHLLRHHRPMSLCSRAAAELCSLGIRLLRMQRFINSLQIGPKVFEIPPDASRFLPSSHSLRLPPSVYSLLCLTYTRSVSYKPVRCVKQLCSRWKLKMTAIISTWTEKTVLIIAASDSLQSLCFL